MIKILKEIWALIRKETILIWKDKRGRIILIMPIVVQTLIFGFIASFDLNRADFAVLDLDHTHSSRRMSQSFDGSEIFHQTATLQNKAQIKEVLDSKKAQMVLVIPGEFEKRLLNGSPAQIQAVISGVNSNVASSLQYYVQRIVEDFNTSRLKDEEKEAVSSSPKYVLRSWYNPNLETRWTILSAIVTILAVIQVMVLAGQSVAREEELGTIDQLLVTPMATISIMIGKAIPPVLVGLLQSTIVLAVSCFFFKIPFSGSLVLLYFGLVLFATGIVGIGLCISIVAKNMQQAMLYSFTVLMPMILLSGFATPIRAMPEIFRCLTYLNPVRYAVEFCQRVFLEGAPLESVATLLFALLLIAVGSFLFSLLLFRRKLS